MLLTELEVPQVFIVPERFDIVHSFATIRSSYNNHQRRATDDKRYSNNQTK